MRDYRFLTDDEIRVLENNSCWAEDWQRVQVAEEFSPYNFHRVIFYGDIRLGVFEKQVEVSKGFVKLAISSTTIPSAATVTSRTCRRWRPPRVLPLARVTWSVC